MITHREKGSRCRLIVIEVWVPSEVNSTDLLGPTASSLSFRIAGVGHVGTVLR